MYIKLHFKAFMINSVQSVTLNFKTNNVKAIVDALKCVFDVINFISIEFIV